MILHKDKIKVTDFMPMFFSNNYIALFAFTNLTPDIYIYIKALALRVLDRFTILSLPFA